MITCEHALLLYQKCLLLYYGGRIGVGIIAGGSYDDMVKESEVHRFASFAKSGSDVIIHAGGARIA